MRRPARLLALVFAAAALLAPALRQDPSAPKTAAPPPPPAKPARAPAASPAQPPPPAGTVFQLEGRPYAVALDEVYLPRRPVGARLLALPPQTDLPALLAHADTLAADAPRLVLYPTGARRDDRTRRILNPALDVRLASAATPTPAARPDLGIVAWERPAYAPAHAVARLAGDPALPLRVLALVNNLPGVVGVRPLLARRHFKKLVPNDPLFKDQWHLRNTGQQSGTSGNDIRAVAAWDLATGAGVTVGIVDDGVDPFHADLSPALVRSLGYDWNDDDDDPSPVALGSVDTDGDDHGTAVAGLVAARGNNGLGLSGSAPAASLAGLRLIGAETDDYQDAGAMAWRNDAIAVKNNSWGPPDAYLEGDYPPDLYSAGPLWAAAIDEAITTGREGRGTLFFWSAGNGQADGDQGSLDGYASCRQVISIGAVTNKGLPASFGEGGPHLVAVAGGDAKIGVVTTDRSGDAGYNSTEFGFPGDYYSEINYTKSFGGTSAAAPIASGVGALLLQLRPTLGWRDVKEILLRSSTPLQSSSADWVSRPAGDPDRPIRHHPRFGGGLINAHAALLLAKGWTPLSPETTVASAALTNLPIPEAGQGSLVRAFTFPADAPQLRVEHAVLTVDIAHRYRGDLEITLTSPAGVVSRFTAPNTQMADDETNPSADYLEYPFNSVRHWGEPSRAATAGWTLTIRDAYAGDAGSLRSATLSLFGTTIVAPTLVSPLAAQSLATGSTLVLRAAFSGGDLTYQWTRDGKPIPGATSPEYRLVNFSAKAAGTYACLATNAAGSATAGPVAVVLDDSPRETLVTRVGSATTFALAPAEIPATGKITGLPAGLTLDRATGALVGSPTRAGTYRIILSSTASDGTVIRRPVTITVERIGTAARYEGVVTRDAVLGTNLGGNLVFNLDGDTGRATGTLRLGAASYPFSGVFGGSPIGPAVLTATIKRGKLRALAIVLEGADATTFAASVSDGAHSVAATVEAVYAAKASAGAFSPGPRTFHLYPQYLDGGLPMGVSFGTIALGADAKATWRLFTADGASALTGSATLRTDGALAFYAPATAPAGSVLGLLPVTSAASVPLTWQRAAAGKTGLQTFPSGIAEHPLIPFCGPYQKPAAGRNLFGGASARSELRVTLFKPEATDPINLPGAVYVTPANRFSYATGTPGSIKFQFTAATGLLTGQIILPELSPKPILIQGAIGTSQTALSGNYVIPAGSTLGSAPVAGLLSISEQNSP